MKPQTEAIFHHLIRHGRITPQQALREHRCFRLAARIQEIRDAGHKVETHYITRNGARFAEYRWMSGSQAKSA